MRSPALVSLACACVLFSCTALQPPADSVAGAADRALAPSPDFVIDVHSNIALHRVFVTEGKTYLEFLDAFRMNPVVTGPDGIPLPFQWNQQYVVLEGVHQNLTVTTPHGVAHVYAKQPAPPSRVAAPTPARAPEYGVTPPLARPGVGEP